VSAIDLERVRARLVAGEVVWRLHYEPACRSTQDLARAAAGRGAGEGWTLVTDLQREGRGRLGRSWVAPKETAILFSTILRPPLDVLPLLPLLAALTVAGGIEVATGAVPDLKWPNDILLNGKKLAGILLEHPAGADVVLGVGLNVNQSQEDTPEGGTSLAIELGHELEREPLLAAILNDLGNAYERADREGVGWIVPGWRSRSSMLGEAIAFHRDGALIRGIAEDILADGALRVRLEDGSRISVVAGEVERVRTAQS
jgi:BirA family transcriptional regulator, biotin operon repressor / biotin---[acetyl-CoA-carboxylase] ligase